MPLIARIERALTTHLEHLDSPNAPPKLIKAIHHAVFPGGARIRPQLCMAVALACGDDAPELTDAASAAIEMMHCASLVHDDMPCFDDASTRRGQLAVHKAYGEPLALLSGDALIVQAFLCLVRVKHIHLERSMELMRVVADSVGAPNGIVAGQAWECESRVDLGEYQRAKTGALFVASTCAGAIASGADPQAWRGLGEALGEAYQVADDIHDVMGDAQQLGKPVGQDAQHGRPSATAALGLTGAIKYFERLIQRAVESIPAGPGQNSMQILVQKESERLVPRQVIAHSLALSS
ncbi:MAG: polyprenyl synthetase family protein [Limnohabitans sp.]|jgi:geranylgeranyl diphosphate synthase type II|nr:polyprenyl synthetase family protein [Limnohabitans sp.]